MVFRKGGTLAIADRLKALRLGACITRCGYALSYYAPQERLHAANPYKQIDQTNTSYQKRISLSAKSQFPRAASSDQPDPDRLTSAFKAAPNPRASRLPRNPQANPRTLSSATKPRTLWSSCLTDRKLTNLSNLRSALVIRTTPTPVTMAIWHRTFSAKDSLRPSYETCCISQHQFQIRAPRGNSRPSENTRGSLTPASYHHRNSRNGTRSELCTTW